MNLIWRRDRFEFVCTFHENDIAKDAGFWWDKDRRVWFAIAKTYAKNLIEYADDEVRGMLGDVPDPEKKPKKREKKVRDPHYLRDSLQVVSLHDGDILEPTPGPPWTATFKNGSRVVYGPEYEELFRSVHMGSQTQSEAVEKGQRMMKALKELQGKQGELNL